MNYSEYTFKLKDQEKFKKLCEVFPKFEKYFQKCCKKHWNTYSSFVPISTGSIINNTYWNIHILKEDIEIVESLKPFVWYEAKEFDGNPLGYILVEQTGYDVRALDDRNNKHLCLGAIRFMYLPNLEK